MQLGQDYTGVSSRAMAGTSLHVVEFVSMAERREGNGAAVCHQPWWLREVPTPAMAECTAEETMSMGLTVGRADRCWLSWHQDRYQILGCS